MMKYKGRRQQKWGKRNQEEERKNKAKTKSTGFY